jgi:ferric-dicitrate binding protein FerR (iron transport regulator)
MPNFNINQLLAKHLTGKLTSEESEALQQWLTDPRHKRQYEKLMNATDATKYLQTMEVVDDREAWKNFRRSYFVHRPYKYYILTAAAVATILFIVVFSMKIFNPVSPTADVIVPHLSKIEKKMIQQSVHSGRNGAIFIKNHQATVLTPQMQKQIASGQPLPESFFQGEAIVKTLHSKEYWLVLEDGTRVHMNYSTTLKYPGHFADDNRTVYLDGEAYFEVNHESGRPFYVITDNGTIKEYGTTFNINTNAGEGITQVALVDGSISIKMKDSSERQMSRGQLATLDSKKGSLTINTVDISPYISWNTGQFIFDGCTMDKLMQVIGNWYDKDVEFDNPQARNILFSGNIDRYKDLQTTLSAIEFVTNCSITLTKTTIRIR